MENKNSLFTYELQQQPKISILAYNFFPKIRCHAMEVVEIPRVPYLPVPRGISCDPPVPTAKARRYPHVTATAVLI